jgi:hypothetical protein
MDYFGGRAKTVLDVLDMVFEGKRGVRNSEVFG